MRVHTAPRSEAKFIILSPSCQGQQLPRAIIDAVPMKRVWSVRTLRGDYENAGVHPCGHSLLHMPN